ncbi:TPA: TrbG/VirB9 family P-type conjugative transfer protein [Neisseria oralis]|jgi:virB9 protein|uniref:TrbG/VirB9 family P-type conjugative transfer protein n=1 Tax=Neisseria oralis TaxID=1107316 RepID=A0ABW8Q4V6_9NEIS|nr:TrbG/VirB9 family P-type conjugative transfer protein [Neisseria sp. oral taxon 014]
MNIFLRKICLPVFIFSICINIAAASSTVTEYTYTPDKIYTVRSSLGIVTQIEISPQEDIKDFGTGYSDGWDLARRENTFYIRPKVANADTNLTIRTAAHNYLFDLKVVSKEWRGLESAKNKGVQYKIKFNYPDGTEFKKEKSLDLNSGLSTKISGHVGYFTNYDYAAKSKSAWLVPTKVYDDGKFTYIYLNINKFMPTGNFPAIFARKDRNGEEMVVNTTIQNNVIIVNGTYPFLVLRHGNDVVGIRRNF